MAHKIVWSETSLSDLADVLSYLKEEWSKQVSDDFTIALEDQLKVLEEFPRTGIASHEQPYIRRVLITKHNALFYTYDEEFVTLLKIVDTRSRKYFTD